MGGESFRVNSLRKHLRKVFGKSTYAAINEGISGNFWGDWGINHSLRTGRGPINNSKSRSKWGASCVHKFVKYLSRGEHHAQKVSYLSSPHTQCWRDWGVGSSCIAMGWGSSKAPRDIHPRAIFPLMEYCETRARSTTAAATLIRCHWFLMVV